jgi:integrase
VAARRRARQLEAQRPWRAEVDVSKQRGAYVPPSKLTVAEYLVDQWVPAIEHTIRPNTFNSYRAEVRNHLVPRLGHVRLRDLRPEHLNKLYGELLRSGYRYGGGLSARSVQYVHIVIGRALRDPVRWQLVVRNIAKDADPPKPERKDAKYWTPEQLRAFVEHDVDDRLQPLWILAATTGARRGELCGLRWVDIDFDAARLTIVQTLVVVGGTPTFSTPKTAAGRRTLSLDPLTISALRAWKARQA